MVVVNPKKRNHSSLLRGYVFLVLVLLVVIISFATFPSLKPVGNKIKKKSLSKLRRFSKPKHNTEATDVETDKMTASKILNSGKVYLVYGTAWKKDTTARLVS